MIKKFKEPVFIIGNPRSGTTLLRLMLTAHSRMVIPPECGFAAWYYDKYKNWKDLVKQNETIINDFVSDLLKAHKFENWKIKKEDILSYLLNIKPTTYSDLVSGIYFFYGNRIKKNLLKWGDKNNFYLNYILTIKKMFPKVKFIHLVRDGRTVACSYKNLGRKKMTSKYAPKLPSKISDIALEWQRNLTIITDSFASFNYEGVIELRFEDLILKPVEKLTELCTFINIDFEERMLNYYSLTENEGLEPKEFLSWKEKTRKPLIKEEADRFKHELTPGEITTFESFSRKFLENYHYL